MKMKKIITTIITMCMLTFTACAVGKSNQSTDEKGNLGKMEKKLYITISGKKATASLEENAATKALLEKLKAGSITYSAHDYGGFEKVGDLGFSLPTSDRQMTSQADRKNNIQRKLKAMPDLSKYDTVFIGSPVWSNDLANPVETWINLNQKEIP